MAGPFADLVERAAQIEQIDNAVDDAASGQGAVVYIEGSRGLGKTALIRWAVRRARERDFEVRAATPGVTERDEELDLLRQLLDDQRSGSLEQQPPDPREGKDSLYQLAVDVCERRTLMLAVDDLHWADAPSLRALAYLAERIEKLPVVVIVTAESSAPGVSARELEHVRAAPNVVRLPLRHLSENAVGLLVRQIVADADDAVVSACEHVTGGNPSLLAELLADLDRNSVVDTQWIERAAPDRVIARVRERLARLGPLPTQLARAIAALGSDADSRRIAALIESDLGAVTDAEETLASAGLLHRESPTTFVYPMVRNAIYAGTPRVEREELHLDAARLLADTAEAGRAATHLLSAPSQGAAWVVDVLREAARDARSSGATASAVEFLQRALDEPPGAVQRADVLVELARAEGASKPEAGINHLELAVDAAVDARARARIRLLLARRLYALHRSHDALRTLEDGLRDLADQPDDEIALRLAVSHIGIARMDTKTRPMAVERLRSLVLHPPAGVTSGEREVLAELAYEAGLNGRSRSETAQLAVRALGGRSLASLTELNAGQRYVALLVLLWAEEFDLTDRAADVLFSRPGVGLLAADVAAMHELRGRTAFYRGRLTAALADATEAAALATLTLPGATALKALCLLELGDVAAATEALELPGEQHWETTTLYQGHLVAQAFVALAKGDANRALAAALEAGDQGAAMGNNNPAALIWRQPAARAAAALGDDKRAQYFAATDVTLARRFGAPRALANTLRTAAAITEGPNRLYLLREALEVLEGSPARLAQAHTLVELGMAMDQAGEGGGVHLLRRGLALAEWCNATALAAKASEYLSHPRPDGDAGRPRVEMRSAEMIELRVLGGFEILRRGERIGELTGVPAQAVKILAVRGALHAEELADMLWPEDALRGRSRLRNVLMRVRSNAGDVVERNGELVELAGDVIVDATRFTDLARRATEAAAADDAMAMHLAERALDAYLGDLLPMDPYADWALAPRERLRQRHLDVIDLLARLLTEQGDPDRAVRLLERGIEADPYAEGRYVAVAELLEQLGRVDAARRALERASVRLAELGLTLSPPAAGIRRRLGH